MKTERIEIENIKCHGCANTIKRELKKIFGVANVTVNVEDSLVVIDYEDPESLKERFINKLASLGYPEKGNNKFTSQVKSYVSCAIGRIGHEES